MESFGKVDQNKNPYWDKLSDEQKKKIEKETMHLTGDTKREAEYRLMEELEIDIPREERIRYYVSYIQEITKGETEEEVKKIIEILESEGIFNKEELETLILGEKSELTQTEKETVKSVFKKESRIPSIIKKILILGITLGTLIGSIVLYKKDKNKNDKNKPLTEENKKKPVDKNRDKIINTTKVSNYDFQEEEERVMAENKDLEYKKLGTTDLENISVDLEKQIEFFKNLDFIKSNFYVLDKSNKLKPTLCEITKEGKIVSAEIVGIGKQEGDNTFGMTTPAGIYAFSKWIEQKDLDLYGENGILRLLGYSINGETVDDIGVHIIYPPEKEERTMKMLNPESSKGISHRCINVFSEYFGKILKNYSGEGKLFIAIMQEKNAFDKEKWNKITKKTSEDMKKLEKAGGE